MIRRTRGDRGQAIIELALTLPLLLAVVMGVFDFGLMFQRYELITNAAREGARVGVLPSYTPGDAIQRSIDYLASGGITGTPACGATALSAGRICVTAVPSSTTITGTTKNVDLITVTVQYDHAHAFVGPIMNVLFGGSMGTVRLQSVSVMRAEPN